MRFARALFALLALALFFPALAYGACPEAKRDIYLAAVTGENSGGIFQLNVGISPGDGTAYTALDPRTGIATQESEEGAVAYAFSSSGADRGECNVFFKMSGDFGGSAVDGPSAGAAMASALRAALLGEQIRQDVVMTGTISPDGKVGPVGGIIEKAIGAAEAGAKYFITPKLAVHEAVLIASLSRVYDFQAIEVGSLEEAEEVLFSDYAEKFHFVYNPQSRPPPPLEPVRMDAELGRFSLVSQNIVGELSRKVNEAYPNGSASLENELLGAYFRSEVAKYGSLVSQGYVFTAANSAFLLSIDVEYAKIGDATVDISGSAQDVSSCISSLPPAPKTRENFHWATGSDLRRIWAGRRLNETLENRDRQGGYTSLRDLLFAYSWCGVSRELSLHASEIGGEPVDESALAPLASQEILSAREAFDSGDFNYDADWHLQNAISANATGNYGAAIYEATYARTMQLLFSQGRANMSAEAARLAQEAGNATSLWGKIYAGHGLYLYREAAEGGFPPRDAYRILRYSRELDRISAEMDRALAAGSSAGASPDGPGQQDAVSALGPLPALVMQTAFAVAVLAFALMLLYRLLRHVRKG